MITHNKSLEVTPLADARVAPQLPRWMKIKLTLAIVGTVILIAPTMFILYLSRSIPYTLLGIVVPTYIWFLREVIRSEVSTDDLHLSKNELFVKLMGIVVIAVGVIAGVQTYSADEMMDSPVLCFTKLFGSFIISIIGFVMLLFRNQKNIQPVAGGDATR